VYSLIFAVLMFLHTRRQSSRVAGQPQTKVLEGGGEYFIYAHTQGMPEAMPKSSKFGFIKPDIPT
jgi:hypothetical protein